jgi:hypothetical protein
MQGNKNGAGKPCSPEKREKIAAAQRGKIIPAEVREKMRLAKLGTKQSPEVIEKRAARLRGRKRPPEVGRKVSLAKMGHIVTEETRRKISETKRRVAIDLRQGALL